MDPTNEPRTVRDLDTVTCYAPPPPSTSMSSDHWEVWEGLPTDEYKFEEAQSRDGSSALCSTERIRPEGEPKPKDENIHIWVSLDAVRMLHEDPMCVLLVYGRASGRMLDYHVVRSFESGESSADRVIDRATTLNNGIVDRKRVISLSPRGRRSRDNDEE